MRNTYGITIPYRKIMRISSLLICIQLFAAYLFAAHTSTAQRISVETDRATVREVFRQIEKQANITFSYQESTLADVPPLTLRISNKSLPEALSEISKQAKLDFKQVGKVIAVSKVKAKPVQTLRPKPQDNTNEKPTVEQQQPIRGKVTDENGEPLQGASVRVQGTQVQTSTDAEGIFTLPPQYNNASLEISYLGFDTYRVLAKNVEVVKLQKSEASIQERNIAVSTGYQTLPAEPATGSFAKVDNELFNRQVSTDVISRLKAIAPSILFDERGGTPRLTIRGISTIFGNDQPLIVVDGFVYDGDIQNINPNDVEDIDILRDAAAASIWGVRAGNGVVVIKTKRGQTDQPMKIELNSNVNIGQKPDMFYQSQMTPTDFIDLEIDLFDRGYYNGDINNTTSRPPLSPVVEILALKRSNTITEAEANRQIDALRNNDVRNDLSRYFYQNSLNQQYNLNMRGGSGKHTYYISGGYDRNLSSQIGNNYNRLSLNTQQTFTPIKNLDINGRFSYMQSNSSLNRTVDEIKLGARNIYPYASLIDDEGNHLPIANKYRMLYVQNAENLGLLNWQYVPLDELNNRNNQNTLVENRFAANVKYTFIKGLAAEASYQYLRQSGNGRNEQNMESFFTRDLINSYTSIFSNRIKRNIPEGAILDFSNSVLNSQTGRAAITYNGEVAAKHEIAAIAGFEVREVTSKGNRSRLYGYDELTGTSLAINYDSLYRTLPANTLIRIPLSEGVSNILDRFRSFFANASYTYNNKYTVSGSARIDQSNLFGVSTNLKSVPLWSAGLKYSIDKEEFYKVDWLPMLKVRATYGYNGNLDNTVTAYTTAGTTTTAFTGQRAAVLRNPPNTNLRWERSAMFNAAIDFGLKNNRLSGSVEYFTRKGTDLIGNGPLNSITGFTAFKGNVASMKGKGVDIILNSINILKPIKWSTTFMYSYAADEITDYQIKPNLALYYSDASVGRYNFDYSPVEGKPLFNLFSNRWAGLNPDTGDPQGYLDGEVSTNYAAMSTAASNAPLDLLVYSGTVLPPSFGAIRNIFDYKQFSLSFNVSFRYGHVFRRNGINYTSLLSYYQTHAEFADRWQNPGDELQTNIPSMVYPANSNRDIFYGRSEIRIEKGDHIRLQDINLSYTFRPVHLSTIKGISAFVYANNVGILWKATEVDIDPDYPTMKLPLTTAIGFRANL